MYCVFMKTKVNRERLDHSLSHLIGSLLSLVNIILNIARYCRWSSWTGQNTTIVEKKRKCPRTRASRLTVLFSLSLSRQTWLLSEIDLSSMGATNLIFGLKIPRKNEFRHKNFSPIGSLVSKL